MHGIMQDNEKNIGFYLNKIHVHVELDSELRVWFYVKRLEMFVFYLVIYRFYAKQQLLL